MASFFQLWDTAVPAHERSGDVYVQFRLMPGVRSPSPPHRDLEDCARHGYAGSNTGNAAIANTRSQLHGQLRGLTLPKLPPEKLIRRDLTRFCGFSTSGVKSGFSTGESLFSGAGVPFSSHCSHEKSFYHLLLLSDLESGGRLCFACRRNHHYPKLTCGHQTSPANDLFTRENVRSAGFSLLAHRSPYRSTAQV
ncbi:hypothetical protein HMPREF0388_0832 [Mobiluncus curtisii ATCC 51333]|uniref:Uncharacterized protein n=1 Tax=Mobiluncus curtisii ATCC 51333 TaxID=887326 RepID=E6LY95_9ACTO|nr:hypothetical protein HMPREF0388_0832 [Mobiluncus curtisii ATCC 51333]